MTDHPSNFDLLQTACYDAGRLLKVAETPLWVGAAMTGALELRFETATLWISVDPEFDTILLHATAPDGMDETPRRHPHAFWDECLGMCAQWAWLMTNQQGYTDGVRFEFGNPDTPNTIAVDIVAVASGLEFAVARPADAAAGTSRS